VRSGRNKFAFRIYNLLKNRVFV